MRTQRRSFYVYVKPENLTDALFKLVFVERFTVDSVRAVINEDPRRLREWRIKVTTKIGYDATRTKLEELHKKKIIGSYTKVDGRNNKQ